MTTVVAFNIHSGSLPQLLCQARDANLRIVLTRGHGNKHPPGQRACEDRRQMMTQLGVDIAEALLRLVRCHRPRLALFDEVDNAHDVHGQRHGIVVRHARAVQAQRCARREQTARYFFAMDAALSDRRDTLLQSLMVVNYKRHSTHDTSWPI